MIAAGHGARGSLCSYERERAKQRNDGNGWTQTITGYDERG